MYYKEIVKFFVTFSLDIVAGLLYLPSLVIATHQELARLMFYNFLINFPRSLVAVHVADQPEMFSNNASVAHTIRILCRKLLGPGTCFSVA